MKLLSKIVCILILVTISTTSFAVEKADKIAENATNYQILVDVIKNAEQGMALLKPQEFANKERPEMPTKYGTHLGGGFPSLREAYQDYIGNDPTLRGCLLYTSPSPRD